MADLSSENAIEDFARRALAGEFTEQDAVAAARYEAAKVRVQAITAKIANRIA